MVGNQTELAVKISFFAKISKNIPGNQKDRFAEVHNQNYLIALGGNLPSVAGKPLLTLRAALKRLQNLGAEIQTVSRFYSTPCFPPGSGPDYVNAAAGLRFDGFEADVMELLHEVESEFGRERIQRWGRRTLDLDLIAAGDKVLPNRETHDAWRSLPAEHQSRETPSQLILPHPRLQDRAFVLVPLADVAPHWVHPLLGKTVIQMLNDLPEQDIAEVKTL